MATAIPGEAMHSSGHVAIVDDDAPMRAALVRLFRIQGINARSYPSGQAFLSVLPAAMPKCLIVDINMPQMTGFDLLRELLDLDIRIPTIVITALADEDVVGRSASMGAVTCLAKPLNQDALMKAIGLAAKNSS